ncbi:Metal-dependent hydrolase, composite domain [Pseudocohnilembus persalinus]|uniref:Metal-dependent hydrolase, composite domain n=1 Tax=Pseudocohnilembus persalinus TaxID=266149 RepID=A0A0V0QEP3_PSEPJ|nr:Metal-dependent hydrolase, composite domain [Pseudocohnilembus persalinus]|eukprot:KRX00674.1 Metal-dependent hydrolase, composite domain [Pseudocohnilembus persalinus]
MHNIKEFYIHSEHVVLKEGLKAAVIHIKDKKINKIIIETEQNQDEIQQLKKQKDIIFLDYHKRYIMPGIIDTNFYSNAGFEQDNQKWYQIQKITRLALIGGVTTIINQPILTHQEWDQTNKIVRKKSNQQDQFENPDTQDEVLNQEAIVKPIKTFNYKKKIELLKSYSSLDFGMIGVLIPRKTYNNEEQQSYEKQDNANLINNFDFQLINNHKVQKELYLEMKAHLEDFLGLKIYISPPIQPGIQHFQNTQQLLAAIQDMQNLNLRKNVYLIHPFKQKGDKDLNVTSPLRQKNLKLRLSSINDDIQNKQISVDAVVGETREELNQTKKDFNLFKNQQENNQKMDNNKYNQMEENSMFLKQFFNQSLNNNEHLTSFLLSLQEQQNYKRTSSDEDSKSSSDEELDRNKKQIKQKQFQIGNIGDFEEVLCVKTSDKKLKYFPKHRQQKKKIKKSLSFQQKKSYNKDSIITPVQEKFKGIQLQKIDNKLNIVQEIEEKYKFPLLNDQQFDVKKINEEQNNRKKQSFHMLQSQKSQQSLPNFDITEENEEDEIEFVEEKNIQNSEYKFNLKSPQESPILPKKQRQSINMLCSNESFNNNNTLFKRSNFSQDCNRQQNDQVQEKQEQSQNDFNNKKEQNQQQNYKDSCEQEDEEEQDDDKLLLQSLSPSWKNKSNKVALARKIQQGKGDNLSSHSSNNQQNLSSLPTINQNSSLGGPELNNISHRNDHIQEKNQYMEDSQNSIKLMNASYNILSQSIEIQRKKSASSLLERRLRNNSACLNTISSSNQQQKRLQQQIAEQKKQSFIVPSNKMVYDKEEFDRKDNYSNFLTYRPCYMEFFAVNFFRKMMQQYFQNFDEKYSFDQKRNSDKNNLQNTQQIEEFFSINSFIFQNVANSYTLAKIKGLQYFIKKQILSQKKNQQQEKNIQTQNSEAEFQNIQSQIYSEVSYPYFEFSLEQIMNYYSDNATIFKNEPPIYDENNRKLLVSALYKTNLIDMIGSYNLQVHPQFKVQQGDQKFKKSFNGFFSVGAHLQQIWSMFWINIQNEMTNISLAQKSADSQNQTKNQNYLSQLIEKSMMKIVDILCQNPAEKFNISKQKGFIQEGNDADFIIWDPFSIKHFDLKEYEQEYKKDFNKQQQQNSSKNQSQNIQKKQDNDKIEKNFNQLNLNEKNELQQENIICNENLSNFDGDIDIQSYWESKSYKTHLYNKRKLYGEIYNVFIRGQEVYRKNENSQKFNNEFKSKQIKQN